MGDPAFSERYDPVSQSTHIASITADGTEITPLAPESRLRWPEWAPVADLPTESAFQLQLTLSYRF